MLFKKIISSTDANSVFSELLMCEGIAYGQILSHSSFSKNSDGASRWLQTEQKSESKRARTCGYSSALDRFKGHPLRQKQFQTRRGRTCGYSTALDSFKGHLEPKRGKEASTIGQETRTVGRRRLNQQSVNRRC